jgi:hypothetical protein
MDKIQIALKCAYYMAEKSIPMKNMNVMLKYILGLKDKIRYVIECYFKSS